MTARLSPRSENQESRHHLAATAADPSAARGAIQARGKWTRSRLQPIDEGRDRIEATCDAVTTEDVGRTRTVSDRPIGDEVPLAPPTGEADSLRWPSTSVGAMHHHRLCVAVDALEALESERREEIVDEELDDLERLVTDDLTSADDGRWAHSGETAALGCGIGEAVAAATTEPLTVEGRRNELACDDSVTGVAAPTTSDDPPCSGCEASPVFDSPRCGEEDTRAAKARTAVEQPVALPTGTDTSMDRAGDGDAVAAFEEFIAAAPVEKTRVATSKRNNSSAPPTGKSYESICPCSVM